ncbi:MAG: hypothetical protein ACXVFT_09825 [Solirubrobacteraceae bacterium]
MSPRSTVIRRVYRDYLQAERLEEFRGLLGRAVALGYETMTLSAFARLVEAADGLAGRERVLLLRHDVDSDVRRARRMWEIECELGTIGSYFFRRATWDVRFMHELQSAGFEVGYHYEELATLVKERGVATATGARELIGPARERLRATLAELRSRSGLPLTVVASHGDFANRVVGVSNVEMLADRDFRAEIGVGLEAYDVERYVDARASDESRHRFWEPMDPAAAIERSTRVVEVLVHPRAWGAAPMTNLRADLGRLLDGARFGLRRVLTPA